MLRFASCRASSRTYMCVPESRQSRSLAYERRAVPYPVACRVPGDVQGSWWLAKAKSCLRASDCVPSRRWIACGLESKLHSDMASQEIRMLRFGPTEHPHAHKTCAPESRGPKALPTNPLLCQRMEKTSRSPGRASREPGPRHAPENRRRRRSGLQAAIRRKAKVRRHAADATEPKHQITKTPNHQFTNQQPTTNNNQQPTTKRPASQ